MEQFLWRMTQIQPILWILARRNRKWWLWMIWTDPSLSKWSKCHLWEGSPLQSRRRRKFKLLRGKEWGWGRLLMIARKNRSSPRKRSLASTRSTKGLKWRWNSNGDAWAVCKWTKWKNTKCVQSATKGGSWLSKRTRRRSRKKKKWTRSSLSGVRSLT